MARSAVALVPAAVLASVCLSVPACGDPATGSPSPAGLPMEGVGNTTLVHATVNGAVRATLILDPSVSTSLVTPLLMARLGQPVWPDARRRAVSVADGQILDVQVVTIVVVQVRDARVEGLEVGVHDLFPEAPEIDGLLGKDFLQRLGVTLDADARRKTPLPQSR